jgi:carboxyl-terminal processing protease
MLSVLGVGFSLGLLADSIAEEESEEDTAEEFQDPEVLLEETYRKLGTFAQALGYIENAYVDPVGAEDLIYGAIDGMMSKLDPHSTFLPPDALSAFQESTEGEYVGVGMEIGEREEKVVVITVFEGGPAADAGLRPDDVIMAVDGEPATEWSTSDVVQNVRGPRGELVTIEVMRGDETKTFEIVRDVIHLDAVSYRLLDNGIGWIRVRRFQEAVAGDIRSAIDSMESTVGGELEGVILDLRGNPGGLLREAISVSDIFLRGGTIVSTAGRGSARQREWAARRGTARYDGPMAVLINGGSASASEIVAGALQDHGRGKVLGNQSFGKGSVQTIITLDDGSGMKLTVSRYFTPDGRSIHEEGITPDTVIDTEWSEIQRPDDEVEDSAEISDAQLIGAIEYLTSYAQAANE